MASSQPHSHCTAQGRDGFEGKCSKSELQHTTIFLLHNRCGFKELALVPRRQIGQFFILPYKVFISKDFAAELREDLLFPHCSGASSFGPFPPNNNVPFHLLHENERLWGI